MRGSRHKRGYDRHWEKVRKEALERDEYLCQHCLKRDSIYTPAKHVDHIKPFQDENGVINEALRLDLENLQSLCQPCHNKKTIQEDKRGFGYSKRQG